MKNILIINLGKSFGGVESHIIEIIKNIDKDKFNINIFCRNNSLFHNNITELKKKGYNFQIYDCIISVKYIMKTLRLIYKIIKDKNIDVVHTHGITSSFLYSLIKHSKPKYISTTHGYCNYDRMDKSKVIINLFNLLELYSLRRCDICIAVSNDIKNYILKKGIHSEKIKVVNHGICVNNNIKNISDNDNIIKVKSLGRLDKVKGFEFLIKALKICVDKGYKNIVCEIAGSGIEYNRLDKLVNDLKLQEYCILVGFVKETDKFLTGASIYVQPSIIESFGISILEAMNNYVPVIASNVGGIKDIIDNDINGILTTPEDYNELAEKILQLINDNDKRKNLASNAKIKLNTKFNISKINREIEELYIMQ